MVPNHKATRSSFIFCFALLAACLTSASCLAQVEKITIATGSMPPINSVPGHPGFLAELARAMFKRIGVEVEISTVPSERSLVNANSGIDDGDLFRVAGVDKEYTNLIRIPEKTLDNDFVAYTKRTDIKIRNWADLQPYAVAFSAGWKPYELNVKGVKDLVKTTTIYELPPLLENGRTDIILMDRWQGQWIIQQGGYKFHLLEPPLARYEMFIYLNKKHAALVPKAAKALADMKADGSYQKLYDLYLKPLDTR